MSEISQIDTSFYPGLIEGFAPTTMQPVPAVETEPQNEAAYYGSSGNRSNNDVDLSNYYDEVKPDDILSQAGVNLSQSAKALDEAMVAALQSGFSVNEVCNMKNAEMAYKASAYVFKVANNVSTFLLEI